MDVTLGAALLAGLLSFLSPCVLPVVPAYLGQLGIMATARPAGFGTGSVAPLGAAATTGDGDAPAAVADGPSGWRAMPNAFAFVLGFTVVFTVVGIVIYQAASPLRDHLPLLRQIGGVILVILGLNLMGVLKFQTLARSWKPLERFGDGQPRQRRGGMIGGFLLGSVFAVGWTPCIGPVLGSILMMAAVGASPQVVSLLIAYSLGLGIPFILVALAVDRAPLVTRPLLRYSRFIEVAGGLLIIFLGLALIFDWLGWFARQFAWLDFSTWIELPDLTEPQTASTSRWKRRVIGPFTLGHLVILAIVLLVTAGLLILLTIPIEAPTQPQTATPGSGFYQTGEPTTGLSSGQLAPELEGVTDGRIVPLRDLEGEVVSLAALRGAPVWLSFFATWCPPCQEETPVLRDSFEAYHDDGLEMVAVSVQETTPTDVAAYAERYSLPYTIGFDASGAVFETYRGFGLPTHVFIDADGVIQQLRYGPIDRETAAGVIEPLLEGGG